MAEMTNMKTGITICMVSLAIACAAWAGSNETAVPKVQSVFRLVSVEADANHGAMGRFAFRHHELRPIQLFGFGFTATNTFRVRFEEFQREEDGKWNKVEVGYCGTGAQLYPIEPNKDYTFLVPLWPYLEKGERGVVEISGTNVTVASVAFETSEIRKIGVKRSRTANHTSDGIRQPADGSPKPSR